MKIRLYLLLAASVALFGCGTDDGSSIVDLAPAAMDNANIGVHLASASQKAKAIAQNGVKPGDVNATALVQDITDAQASQVKAQADLATAQKQAQDQANLVAKLKAEHLADQKAVTRRNFDILIALFVGSLVFYAGEWAKLSNPYTTLLPNVVAGLLAVMAFTAVTAVIITLWSSFGWLVHLF